MALQIITNINVDFYDKKYILINAKQYDKSSRFLLVTCYNQGELYPINVKIHSAYIRYKKSDGCSVFNFCEITNDGKVLVELTEKMLASDGICFADLVIVNKGDAVVDAKTGEIVAIDNASILSTMAFCIDVSETAVNNSEIESSYEYDGLNDLLGRAEADYENVVLTAQSWAVGGTNIRANENKNNAKYYATESKNYYHQVEIMMRDINGAFLPKGTITFAELLELKDSGVIDAGHLYHISDGFTTDENFRVSGKECIAGTNVYYTIDDTFDIFVGTTVAGVKGENEAEYRTGVINITPENVGAVPTTDIATIDEIKKYLGI